MKHTYLLILVFTLAVLLRFINLSHMPPSLSWDEVSFGYNAWSILKTGKDEYGTSSPFLFRAFDEYKQPGLVYVTAASEAVFGLNEFAVRFPAALSGVGIVIYLYLIGKKLINQDFGILFAFLGAINPWLINFSRQGFESTVSLFFVTSGLYYLLRFKENRRYVLMSAFLFAVSTYFYHATRIVTPLILISFAWVYRNELLKRKRHVVYGFLTGLMILIPLFLFAFSDRGVSRLGQVLLTDDQVYIGRQETYARKILEENNSVMSRILYNRRRAFVEAAGINYYRNIHPDYVFRTGTISAGLLYQWELPFFLSGLYFLITEKKNWKWVILTWLIVYPLAGAFTKDQPNALRTLIGAPPLIMTSALGVWFLFTKMKRLRLQLLASGVLAIIIVYFSYRFLFNYFVTAPETRAVDFGDGHKQLAAYLQSEQENYDMIWVTGDYWRPYIHLLFHLKYDPAQYHESGTRDGFGKFRFGNADWDTEGVDLQEVSLDELAEPDTKTLFVLSPKEYQHHISTGRAFKTAQSIDGLYAPQVFYAVTL
ncbi:MAG: glycosyltransferase family 39 protein [Candidatus Roizmanbacteria bacterium]|nr:glycosyltransferase family 39 protein [Candidatus Roizmanbacteria bacterium]